MAGQRGMAQWQSPCCTSMKTRLLASVSTIQKHMPKPKSQTKTNKTNTNTGQGGMSLQTKCWRAGDRWVPGPAGQAAPPTQQLPGQGEQGRWNDRDRYRLSSGLYMCMHKCAYWPAHLSQATSLRRFMSRKGEEPRKGLSNWFDASELDNGSGLLYSRPKLSSDSGSFLLKDVP